MSVVYKEDIIKMVLHWDVAHILCNSHVYPWSLRLVIYHWVDGICIFIAGHGVFRMDDKRAGIVS